MKVKGTQQTVQPIEINKDTVYVRQNIIRIETEEFTGWEYDEQQYSKDEYIQLIAEENNNLKQRVGATEDVLLEMLINAMQEGGV